MKKRVTPEWIHDLAPNEVFVFGSNLGGMHGGGAARIAYRCFGAKMGVGVGLQGQSYAIPTMQGGPETIRPYVDEFIDFARQHPETTFLVTPIRLRHSRLHPRRHRPALPGRGGGGERLAAREFLAFAEDTGMRFNLQFNLSLSKLFLMIRSGSRRIILRYDLAARLSRIVRCGPLRQLLNKWKTKCCKNKTS